MSEITTSKKKSTSKSSKSSKEELFDDVWFKVTANGENFEANWNPVLTLSQKEKILQNIENNPIDMSGWAGKVFYFFADI